MSIKINLTAANMGNVDEIDFDCWAAFVDERIDVLGLEVSAVTQVTWGREMPAQDEIRGATEEQAEIIRRWLGNEGWETFCGEEWETRRKAREAA